MSELKITVFTPTYNRAYIIENLYRSLQRQSFTDFEWLVIDDGSTDQTKELFESWMEEKNPFFIRYYKQENGGKCRAINRALDLAEGELFFTVDSDDYLTDDALEKIVCWMNSLPNKKYCGVAGNLGISAFETSNKLFENQYFDGTALDRYRIVDGERAMVFFTDVHRKHKYPEFENENFMTEAVAWNRMAHDGYKMRFYNDIVCVYEYREDGLTKAGSSVFLNNPYGYGIWLKEKALFEHHSFRKRMKMYYTFMCDLQEQYAVRIVAECIGTSPVVIRICKMIHKLRSSLRR